MRKYVSILIIAFVWLSSEVFAATPTIVATSVSSNGRTIKITFSNAMNTIGINNYKSQFSIKVNGTVVTSAISKIAQMLNDNTSFDFSLNTTISYGAIVTLTYTGSSIKDASGNVLLTFTDLNIDNGIATPSVNGYLEDFNDNTLTGWAGNTQYTLTESNQVLNIDANSDKTYKSFSFTIPVSVNMTSSPTVTFTLNTATAVDLRVDVQDAKGFTTNNTENKKTGLTTGIFTYTFTDFNELYDSLGTKLSSPATVDKTVIKRVFIYTNPGATFSGSFTIDNLTIGIAPTAVTGVTVSPTSLTMNLGENQTLSATIAPSNATDSYVTWTSSDKTIATVAGNGVVTALAQGSAIITATSLDNATLFATTTITVVSSGVNKTTLASEITTANNLKALAVVGLQAGQYLQTDIDAFSTAITNAQAVKNDGTATQASVDAMDKTLLAAISTFTSKAIVINKQALTSLISTATAMTTTAVAGTQKGQYAQGDIDALSIVIVKAQNINNSTIAIQSTVDSIATILSNAMTVFASKVVTVDKSKLVDKIDSATTLIGSAVIGSLDGQYSKVAVDSLQTAITNAKSVNDLSTNQTDITAMVITLQTAMDLFTSKMISSIVTKVALQTKISSATALKTSATVGTHVGEYAQADINTLSTAISNAEALNTNTFATQSAVNEMVKTLQTAMDAFSLTVVPVPSKKLLQTAIDSANNLLNKAVAGTAINQYPQSAIDALTTERKVADTTNTSTSVNQSEVDTETSTLEAAIKSFNARKITSVTDYSQLQTAIADATTLASKTTIGAASGNVSQEAMTALNTAIKTAQAVNTNTTASQSQIDVATSSLQTAVQTFQSAIIKTDISELDAVSITATPVVFNESITIKSKGIQMKSVTLFAITGAVVAEENGLSESIRLSTSDLPQGLYLILVKLSNGNSKVLKVVK